MNDVTGTEACILVVDDDDAHRMITSRALARLDAADRFCVQEAASGREALDRLADLLERHPAVLVLSDYVMPELDGLQLVEEIQRVHPDAPVRFAVFSSMASPPAGKGPAGDDATGPRVRFLEKPMELGDYRAMLDAVVEGWLDSLEEGPDGAGSGGDAGDTGDAAGVRV